MTVTPALVLSAVSVLLFGLSAGVFFTYSNSVMPGLRRTDDHTYVTAFNGMNVAILNPLFFVVFVGAQIASVVTHRRARARARGARLVAGRGDGRLPHRGDRHHGT